MIRPALLAAIFLGLAHGRASAADPKQVPAIYQRDNLVAWCIVPFDSKERTPEERAAMLKKLGFKKFAYDWRGEHLPTFEAEIAALKKEGIELTAVWFPAGLNKDAQTLLDALKKHEIKTQLWVTMGGGAAAKTPDEQARKVRDHAKAIKPIVEAAAKIDCTVALYNHGSWFGEPENQIAIIKELNLPNVGIVYNLHHGHDHLDRIPELIKAMKPHLLAFNLNGMIPDGERKGKKILPLGQGELDLKLMKLLADSGWNGPVGILGHTNDDAEERLKDNLDGFDWLVPQLAGEKPGPKPMPRTYKASAAPAGVPGWLAAGKKEYRTPPLTVECIAKLTGKGGYNILVACDTKASAAHWELYISEVAQDAAQAVARSDRPRAACQAEMRQQAAILRDIFGNPFRPVSFDAEWRTSTAVALAMQIYESRDFDAMPILADALQDAGCDNADILSNAAIPH